MSPVLRPTYSVLRLTPVWNVPSPKAEFMAGPIAARLVGPGAPLLLPAGCIGALLVLASDLAGQFLFDERYPVGVITGVLGAPYLILLLIRMNRTGSSI